MEKVLIVILNYKNYQMTISLLEQVQRLNYPSYDIMVIDNASPNESANVLDKYCVKNGIEFFENKENSGYAAGNNIGIRYAIMNNYSYTWILNNDIKLIDYQILSKMVKAFELDKSIACVGPKIYDADGKICSPYPRKPSLWSMTFGILNEKRKRSFQNNKSQVVYRLHGCSMLLKSSAMKKVDCLDERTFLFCEEEILAERLAQYGMIMYYLASTSLIHMESSTIKLDKGKAKLKAKQMCRSMELYLKEYRDYGYFARLLCKLTRTMIILFKG